MTKTSQPQEWDEPILASSRLAAKRKCKNLAETYSEEGHPVESLEPEYIPQNAHSKTQQPNFRCKFRS